MMSKAPKRVTEPKNKKVPEGPIQATKYSVPIVTKKLLKKRLKFTTPNAESWQTSAPYIQNTGPSET